MASTAVMRDVHVGRSPSRVAAAPVMRDHAVGREAVRRGAVLGDVRQGV